MPTILEIATVEKQHGNPWYKSDYRPKRDMETVCHEIPDMTDEKKEREAERLFVLSER